MMTAVHAELPGPKYQSTSDVKSATMESTIDFHGKRDCLLTGRLILLVNILKIMEPSFLMVKRF